MLKWCIYLETRFIILHQVRCMKQVLYLEEVIYLEEVFWAFLFARHKFPLSVLL